MVRNYPYVVSASPVRSIWAALSAPPPPIEALRLRNLSIRSRIYQLITMNSRGIPVHKMNTSKRHQDLKSAKRAGFIQALEFIERPKRSGARASRHPPRWHA